jgi:23S rRNA (guanine745-N1)-methyltransferase
VGPVIELGAGTAHHLAPVLDRFPDRAGIALDNSAPALRRAARAHPRIGAVGCDAWGALPLRTGAAAVALNVFSPRHGSELARVLAGGGTLIVAAPTVRHLAELVDPLGILTVDPAKGDRLARHLEPHFRPAGEPRPVEWPLSLGHADLRRLVAMGPSAHHVEADALERAIAALPDPTPATASVEIRALVPLAP